MKIDIKSTDLFSGGSGKLSSSAFFLSLALGFVFLTLVLAFPTCVTAFFDGLPWTGPIETLIIFVLLPFLLILGYRFLSLQQSIIYLFVLLALKAVMVIGAPASGWQVKVFPGMTLDEVKQNGWHEGMYDTVTSGKWVKTYATLWNEDASGVLKSPWTHKKQFPMDWFLPYGLAPKNEVEQFDALNTWVQFKGGATLPEELSLVIVAQGVVAGTLETLSSTGKKFSLPVAKNYQEASELAAHAPKGGGWTIDGKLQFEGADWSFVPVLVDANGIVTPELGRGVLWQDESALSMSSGSILFYIGLSWIVDICVALFFIVWVVWTARFLVHENVLSLSLSLFSFMAIVLSFVMGPILDHVVGLLSDLRNILFGSNIVPISNINKIYHLGFSIALVSVVFLVWTYWRNNHQGFFSERIGSIVFLLYGPATLIFFSCHWLPQIEQWSLWSQGNDWATYQIFARKIMVDGEWLNAGAGVFIMQPLYRYFIGIYHWLFGQSAFVQRMADVWCILGASLILSSWIVKLRMMSLVAFIVSTAYLMINFIGTFRYRIGEGLIENHAMIFMMLAAWFMYSAQRGGYQKVFLATLFGILGYWLRQDHLGAIAGLAFLVLEPVDGITNSWKGYWDRFKLRWKQFTLYWVGGITSVLLIWFRNWWVGGDFYFTQLNHPNLNTTLSSPFPGSFYIILTGNVWPTFPNLAGFIVTIGTVLGLLAIVWRPKIFVNFPLSLGIILFGLLLPYVFLWNWAYEPRYSIHLLPLALLVWAILLNNIFERYSFPLKYLSKKIK
jgi:hypothetical protein